MLTARRENEYGSFFSILKDIALVAAAVTTDERWQALAHVYSKKILACFLLKLYLWE